jgi:hypothetical protein
VGSGVGVGVGSGSGSGHFGPIGLGFLHGIAHPHGFELQQEQLVSSAAVALGTAAGVCIKKDATKQKTIGMAKIDHATQSLVLWQIKSIKSVAKTPKSPCPGIRDQLRSYKS